MDRLWILCMSYNKCLLDSLCGVHFSHFHKRFDYDGDGNYEDWTEMNMSYVCSAGCIVSTARDMAVWMEALAGGNLLSEEFRPYLFEGFTISEGVVYGAGILTDNSLGIGHNGTVIGFHADAWFDPETGSTVAVLSNTNAPLLDDDRDPTLELPEPS